MKYFEEPLTPPAQFIRSKAKRPEIIGKRVKIPHCPATVRGDESCTECH
jgi:hypothetical protein